MFFWVFQPLFCVEIGLRSVGQMTDSVVFRQNIILVVDDEQMILRLATTAIAEAGF